jgi:hypothetical protein
VAEAFSCAMVANLQLKISKTIEHTGALDALVAIKLAHISRA